jgi:hypothetical protein
MRNPENIQRDFYNFLQFYKKAAKVQGRIMNNIKAENLLPFLFCSILALLGDFFLNTKQFRLDILALALLAL